MAAPRVIQDIGVLTGKPGLDTVTTAAIGKTTQPGNVIVAVVALELSAATINTPGMTDSNLRNYFDAAENSDNQANHLMFFTLLNPVGYLTTDTLTLSMNGAGQTITSYTIHLFEISGAGIELHSGVTNPYGKAAATGSSTAPTVTSTAVTAGETLFFAAHAINAANGATDTISSTGYTLVPTGTTTEGTSGGAGSTNSQLKTGYQTAPNNTAVTFAGTISSAAWVAGIIGFRASAPVENVQPILMKLARMTSKLRKLSNDYLFVDPLPAVGPDYVDSAVIVSFTRVIDFNPPDPYPFNPVLDDFNRADQGPPPSAQWSTTPIISGESGLQVVSNQLDSAAVPASSYWLDQVDTPDCEVYATIASLSATTGTVRLFARLRRPGTALTTGYCVAIQNNTTTLASNQVVIQRLDNGALTSLAIISSYTPHVGDKFRLVVEGNVLYVFTLAVGTNDWVRLLTFTDNTYPNAGYIGARFSAASDQAIDDFGGGEYTREIYGHTTPTPSIQPLLFGLDFITGRLKILRNNILNPDQISTGPTDYIDSTTVESDTSVQSSENTDFLDTAGTIQGTSSITTTETTDYVDSATVSSVSSITSVEFYVPFIQEPSHHPLLVTLRDRLFKLITPVPVPDSIVVVGITYTDSATISGTTSVQSSESTDFLDTSGAVQGTSSITSTETAQYVEAATAPSTTSLTYTETTDFVETAIVSSVTSLTSVEVHVPFIQEPSHHPLLPTLSRIDGIRLLHNNILIPAIPLINVDYVDSATITSVTSLSAVETADYIDGTTPSGVTSLISTEVAADVESATVSTVTSLSAVETADYVDSSTVSSITSLTSVELYVPFIQEPSHRPLLITLKRGELRLLNNNILNPASPLTTVDYTDSATISSVTSIQASDSTNFLDTSGTVQGTSTITSTESTDATDASTIAGSSSVSYTELTNYAESNTVAGSSSVTTVDTSDFVDANTASSVTSIQSDEQFIPFSTVVANTTQAILIRLAKYHPKFRHLLGDTLSPVTHVPVDYIDSQTISSSTSVTSTETAQFVDTATPPSVTSPSSTDTEDGSDANTVRGTTSLSATDILAALESNTVSGNTSITSVDVSAYSDSNTASGVTSITSTDFAAYLDAGSLSSVTSVISTEQKISTDTGTASTITTVNYTEFANYVDGVSVNNITTVTADEQKSAGNTDFSTVTSITSIISYEIGALVRFALTARLVGRKWEVVGYDTHYSCAGSKGKAAEIAGQIHQIVKIGRRWLRSLL